MPHWLCPAIPPHPKFRVDSPGQRKSCPPSLKICWCNTWTKGQLLDDFYDTFWIIKGPDTRFCPPTEAEMGHFRFIPSVLFAINYRLWVPRAHKNLKMCKTTFLKLFWGYICKTCYQPIIDVNVNNSHLTASCCSDQWPQLHGIEGFLIPQRLTLNNLDTFDSNQEPRTSS